MSRFAFCWMLNWQLLHGCVLAKVSKEPPGPSDAECVQLSFPFADMLVLAIRIMGNSGVL